MLRETDMWWHAQTKAGSLKSFRGEMSPMEQWRRQCFVTTFFAEDEVQLRHTLGIGNMMWGSDFPHVEGTYPSSRRHLAKIFGAVPREEVEAIVANKRGRDDELRPGQARADRGGQDSLAPIINRVVLVDAGGGEVHQE